MASLTTIALLERRRDISRDLFTRYWRDVHGVMAARIPGFASYVQHHVIRVGGLTKGPEFEGVALVDFACEDDRQGLATSAIIPEIVRDEPNVFARALLYNLSSGDVTGSGPDGAESGGSWMFALFEEVAAAQAFADSRADGAWLYDLGQADPSLWNGIAADEIAWRCLVHYRADPTDPPPDGPGVAVYRTEHRFVMVDEGRPTPLGLRGADALRTIQEAGAVNQLDPTVEALVYRI